MKTCNKCNAQFSPWVKIDGKNRNLNSRKFCLVCSPFGKHNTRDIVTTDLTCEMCHAPLTGNQRKFCSKKCKTNGFVPSQESVLKFDWLAIQNAYDTGLTTRQLKQKFKLNDILIARAGLLGVFKARTKSEAQKLSLQKSPRKLTKETRDKISKARRAFLAANPDKVPYKLNHYSKGPSYPEQYFSKWLTDNNISFEPEKQILYYNIDFLVHNIALEIDGDQHHLDPRIVESNIRRDTYLLEKGIETIRVRWSTFKKMGLAGRTDFLSELFFRLTT